MSEDSFCSFLFWKLTNLDEMFELGVCWIIGLEINPGLPLHEWHAGVTGLNVLDRDGSDVVTLVTYRLQLSCKLAYLALGW